MIEIRKTDPRHRILELGGGDNPNPASDVRVDVRPGKHTHFTADFNKPLPINSDDFEGLLCFYCLEHVSWRNTRAFLKECLRVLKPGCAAIFTIPDTEAQFAWAKDNPDGWDGQPFFESASAKVFGGQDYGENAHAAYFSKSLASELFQDAGFAEVQVRPWGARNTDLLVQAVKPSQPPSPGPAAPRAAPPPPAPQAQPQSPPGPLEEILATPLAKVYDHDYFWGGGRWGGYRGEGYWDYPWHEATARHVLDRRPESVLELGCAKGFVLKRLQDAGLRACGLDVSRHQWMVRCCEGVLHKNVCETPWPFKDREFDLCLSMSLLEHVPEAELPRVLTEAARVSRRGLHGITFWDKDDGSDQTRITLRSREWWQRVLTTGPRDYPMEVFAKEELEAGQLGPEVLKGDGKFKVHVGSFRTMFHRGWKNLDVHDLGQWASQWGYDYVRHDARHGLPFDTGVGDLIFAHHFLEHLTFEEAKRFLRDCRRVLKKGGALRLIMPNADFLAEIYEGGDPQRLLDFAEVNKGVREENTALENLHALLWDGHHSCWDALTLVRSLEEAGFEAKLTEFRRPAFPQTEQILKETFEAYLGYCLFVDAVAA